MVKFLWFLLLPIVLSTNGYAANRENFRVDFRVNCNDRSLKSMIEEYLKKELISIGDIEIVSSNPEHIIEISIMPIELRNNEHVGYVFLSQSSVIFSYYEFKGLFAPKDPNDEVIKTLYDFIFDNDIKQAAIINNSIVDHESIASAIDNLVSSLNKQLLEPSRKSGEPYLRQQTKKTSL